MRYSTWAGPWDWEYLPKNLRVRMAYAYHGGRLYLPKHPRHRVYELPESAAFFPVDLKRFGKLRPIVMEPRVRIERAHAAWLVLCHNDALGKEHPEYCVRNQYGDVYSYALCPSHPVVQDYCVELCKQAVAQPYVDELDLEALGWLGYAHNGLHEKCGVELSRGEVAALSQCHCEYCQRGEGADWALLRRIRSEVKVRLNLRTAWDAGHRGGKFACAPERVKELEGLVDAVTLTYFGLPMTFQKPRAGYEVHAGFVAHAPDCRSDAEREARLRACEGADEIAFYSWSLADAAASNWMEEKGKQKQ